MNTLRQTSENLPPRMHGKRGAASVLEVFIACTLLSTVLGVSTPLIVKHGRLLKAQRDYRLALDELSNQLERLRALPPNDLREAAANVAPSEFARASLPGVTLRSQVETFDFGQRLTLFATWQEIEKDRAPLTLTIWIFAEQGNRGAASATEESP